MKCSLEKKKSEKFPKLLRYVTSDLVILATAEENNKLTAVVLYADPFYSLGEWSSKWDATLFTDFTGSIKLEND